MHSRSPFRVDFFCTSLQWSLKGNKPLVDTFESRPMTSRKIGRRVKKAIYLAVRRQLERYDIVSHSICTICAICTIRIICAICAYARYVRYVRYVRYGAMYDMCERSGSYLAHTSRSRDLQMYVSSQSQRSAPLKRVWSGCRESCT